jgi:hypothetical protein
MLASVTKRRGYLLIPGVRIYGGNNPRLFPIIGKDYKSLFSYSRLFKHTMYLCKEGIIYVSGNSWLYRLTSDTGNLYKWACTCAPNVYTGVWLDEDGNPIEFEKVSRVELLFSS